MDQTQIPSVDDDLQKAIDNITNTTNIDPVFSDPVAAPSTIPEGDTGELDEPIGPFPAPELPPAPEPTAMPNFGEMPPMPNFAEPAPVVAPEEPTPEFTVPEPIAPAPVEETPTTDTLSMQEVKTAALRDLVPILDHLNINVSQKFNIYKDIFETLKDYTVLSRAYDAAKQIESDAERAEALLYLIESIDRM